MSNKSALRAWFTAVSSWDNVARNNKLLSTIYEKNVWTKRVKLSIKPYVQYLTNSYYNTNSYMKQKILELDVTWRQKSY